MNAIDQPLLDWFAQRAWTVAPFQREVWRRFLRGESGLLHTPTGSGKTLAAFGGPLLQALQSPAPPRAKGDRSTQLRVLWITPLRALAADSVKSLRMPIDELGIPWTVAMRTGDASARDRRLSKEGRAEVVVITPESLALMLSYPESSDVFSALSAVIVDEWHELIGNKRGVLLQLCLARLRKLAPPYPCWGLSATLGNLDEARDVLLPNFAAAIVSGATPRAFKLETLVPAETTRFPWAGHLGLSQLKPVLERLLEANTSIVFTNTRSQAELWHQALAAVWPDAPETLALHHGSLSAELRSQAEKGLREGTVRCVVSTSSLDLGVDFPAVDLVFQIGSPKGISRLLQRSGRAKHRPGEPGHIVCVPAHALELAEYAAARDSVARGDIEPRHPPTLCLDVLAQHCVTIALGGGFVAEALLAEVRTTHAFAGLSDEMWQQTIDFVVQGGAALSNYPEYRKVVRDDEGVFRVPDRAVATRHRLSIGTITSDSAIDVRFMKGKRLGSIEEAFLSRLRPGDRFQFAGRTLTLVRLENMAAYVRVAKAGNGVVPRWQGGRMPLSSQLGAAVERLLSLPRQAGREMIHLRPLIQTQAEMSALPAKQTLLVEWTQFDDKWYLTVYPFAGRAINEGIAALATTRWSRLITTTFAYTANDYGLIIGLPRQTLMDEVLLRELLSPEKLIEDLLACVNVGELSRRQFREIARIAGLLPPSMPGKKPRTARHLQASAGLIFDVLQRFDPGHVLLSQAQREVFEAQLDVRELSATLARCARSTIHLTEPIYLSPLAFPLWAERWRAEWSNEAWKDRVAFTSEQMDLRYS
ncbi:MAG TPA: ligase-associated DNA damage response DEXH box helicase [Rudaea sp.]|jgi:ATP-dependent Lhr-like helicase|nr:ligase-associated DNA damage response DEXH box helicase [Rudaea sp.]